MDVLLNGKALDNGANAYTVMADGKTFEFYDGGYLNVAQVRRGRGFTMGKCFHGDSKADRFGQALKAYKSAAAKAAIRAVMIDLNVEGWQ